MTHDVFLSYKREDERRTLDVRRALERHGLSVWWDRELPNAEDWRAITSAALDAARCIVVLWTDASVRHTQGFVMDEANRGRLRGVLVPVALDKVDPPLGFGQLQTLDLSHWRGGWRDPIFLDLVAAVRAKIAGVASPPARGPLRRLSGRWVFSGLSTGVLAAGLLFGMNVGGVQTAVCSIRLGQPGLSDSCGALHLGGKPAQAERVAWERLVPGSCDALRGHIAHFPDGAYASQAAALLASRRIRQAETWTPRQTPLPLRLLPEGEHYPSRQAAQAAALTRGAEDAETACRGLSAATMTYRLNKARPEAKTWDCSSERGGHICGFSGDALCDVEVRGVVETETCGRTTWDSTSR